MLNICENQLLIFRWKVLLRFYFCKCLSVNYLGQDLGQIFSCLNFTLALLIVVQPQRFSSDNHLGRKPLLFLGYSTLAVKFLGKRKDKTHYLALLSVHFNLFRQGQASQLNQTHSKTEEEEEEAYLMYWFSKRCLEFSNK